MQQLKTRRRRWHYTTSQHSVEHQGAIKHSFQTTQFEHVCYKVHRVGSGYCICFSSPHPQSLSSNCRTKRNMIVRYQIFQGISLVCAFQNIFTCMKACLSQPMGQRPYYREHRYFQGCSRFTTAGVP